MLIDEDVYLEHYGVKGMKWGRRKATSSTGMTNRQLNKQSKEKDKADRIARTMEARKTYKRVSSFDGSGNKAFRRDLKAAKKEYKNDKREIGSREAKKILAGKRGKMTLKYAMAQQPVNRKEKASRIIYASLGVPQPYVNWRGVDQAQRVFGGK